MESEVRQGGDERGSEVSERRGLGAIGAKEPGTLRSGKVRGVSKWSNLEKMGKKWEEGDRTGLTCRENRQEKDVVVIEGEEYTAAPSNNGYGRLRGNVEEWDGLTNRNNLKVVVNFGEEDGGGLKMKPSGLEKEGERDDGGGDDDCKTPVVFTRISQSTSSCSSSLHGGVGGGEDVTPRTPRDDGAMLASPRLPPDFRNQKARHEMYKKRGGEGRRLSWRRKRVGLDPRRDLNAILQHADGESKSPPHAHDPLDDMNMEMSPETLREESEEP